jgi:SAM-dependent methyltransferase
VGGGAARLSKPGLEFPARPFDGTIVHPQEVPAVAIERAACRMHPEEAEWFGARLPVNSGSPGRVLNIGSSTREFRTVSQPYIEEKLFEPLKERGFEILHVDQKSADGVDLVGDLHEPDFVERLSRLQADVVFCNNLLMHLKRGDRERLIVAVDRILRPGGLLYLSTATRYPYTSDPYDSYYRPDDRQLAALFPEYEVVDSTVVQTASSFLDTLRTDRAFALKVAARALVPVYKPWSWYVLMRYLPQIRRPYTTACVVLRKP